MTSLRVNRLRFPVTVLGPGRRLGLWLQGCTIACPGCTSRDTWSPTAGVEMTVAELTAACAELGESGLDGITISGGEPFEQPAGLFSLLGALHTWRAADGARRDIDILCYSGWSWRRLQRHHAAILARLDAVISEPFVATRPQDRLWRGSANQRLVPLSPLGRERYAASLDAPPDPASSLQLFRTGDQLEFIGIPPPGTWETLSSRLAPQGLEIMAASWQT